MLAADCLRFNLTIELVETHYRRPNFFTDGYLEFWQVFNLVTLALISVFAGDGSIRFIGEWKRDVCRLLLMFDGVRSLPRPGKSA